MHDNPLSIHNAFITIQINYNNFGLASSFYLLKVSHILNNCKVYETRSLESMEPLKMIRKSLLKGLNDLIMNNSVKLMMVKRYATPAGDIAHFRNKKTLSN